MIEDRTKIATLVRHWLEHNEGHRQSYLEWKEKLLGAGLPETEGALERVARLTEEINRELERAVEELAPGTQGHTPHSAMPTSAATGGSEGHSHEHSHTHSHGHDHAPGEGHDHPHGAGA